MRCGASSFSSADYDDGDGRSWATSSNPGVEYSFDEPWMARVDGNEMTIPELNHYVSTGSYQQDMEMES